MSAAIVSYLVTTIVSLVVGWFLRHFHIAMPAKPGVPIANPIVNALVSEAERMVLEYLHGQGVPVLPAPPSPSPSPNLRAILLTDVGHAILSAIRSGKMIGVPAIQATPATPSVPTPATAA